MVKANIMKLVKANIMKTNILMDKRIKKILTLQNKMKQLRCKDQCKKKKKKKQKIIIFKILNLKRLDENK